MKHVIVARPTTSDVGLRTSGLQGNMNTPSGRGCPAPASRHRDIVGHTLGRGPPQAPQEPVATAHTSSLLACRPACPAGRHPKLAHCPRQPARGRPDQRGCHLAAQARRRPSRPRSADQDSGRGRGTRRKGRAQDIAAQPVCGIGSSGGPRLSLADCVMRTGPRGRQRLPEGLVLTVLLRVRLFQTRATTRRQEVQVMTSRHFVIPAVLLCALLPLLGACQRAVPPASVASPPRRRSLHRRSMEARIGITGRRPGRRRGAGSARNSAPAAKGGVSRRSTSSPRLRRSCLR